MRAISLRTARRRPWLSSWPVAPWKRRLNSSSLASASLLTSSSGEEARSCSAVKPVASGFTQLSLDDLALDGELVDRAAQRLAGHRLVDTGQLEHHPARLDVGDPPLGRTLARAHARLGRLLGQRTVGVDVDPHLAATPDVPGHRDTGRLDLAVGDVSVLEGLDAELPERDAGATAGGAGPVRTVLLAVRDLTRN